MPVERRGRWVEKDGLRPTGLRVRRQPARGQGRKTVGRIRRKGVPAAHSEAHGSPRVRRPGGRCESAAGKGGVAAEFGVGAAQRGTQQGRSRYRWAERGGGRGPSPSAPVRVAPCVAGGKLPAGRHPAGLDPEARRRAEGPRHPQRCGSVGPTGRAPSAGAHLRSHLPHQQSRIPERPGRCKCHRRGKGASGGGVSGRGGHRPVEVLRPGPPSTPAEPLGPAGQGPAHSRPRAPDAEGEGRVAGRHAGVH